jgi:ascorbate-specific PTS system EIIC-type component UlaA
MTRKNLWTRFWAFQIIGTFAAITGVNYMAITGKTCLLPGYLVAWAVLRKFPFVSTWLYVAVAIPVNGAIWYIYSRFSKV